MIHTTRSFRGAVTAPHHLAAQAGLRVLDEGGNALEAMVAAAATVTAAYPHMNSLGGDNFWLIHTPSGPPTAIDACGGAAALADINWYASRGYDDIPSRGPLAALTVAGTVSGWQRALEISAQQWGGTLPLARLLEDAIELARGGVAVSASQSNNTHAKLAELADSPGFLDTFAPDGASPEPGARFTQPRLADTLHRLGKEGLDSFYRGSLARSIAADLERAGSPLRFEDLERHAARTVTPLALDMDGHRLYNLPPPTQGLASLLLLGVFDRLEVPRPDDFRYVHALVEAAKCAFRVRDRVITDPDYMQVDPASFLDSASLDRMAAGVDMARARPWPETAPGGDTVWLGAVDAAGRAVSFIQSIYWEFGSGMVLEESGITWQNRGVSFSLDPRHHNHLQPRRRPFHTIQPALARLADGRVMVYGTMGGEGQPQTQAALFTRHVTFGQPLQTAVTAPRWLLGRTWGAQATRLRIEDRFPAAVVDSLRAAGHDVEVVDAFDEIMGHAGALVLHPDDLIEGASDPRSDGAVAAR